MRGEAPGAAARPPCPGQGGLPAPRRPGGGAGPWAVPWPRGARERDVPRLGRGARRGTRADPDPGRAAAGAGAVPLRADAPRRPGRGGGGGRSPARAHGDGRAAAGPGEGGGASCRPHREETGPPAVACRYREGSWLLGERHRSPHPSLGEAGSEQRREKVHPAKIETK